jgi:histidine triad (HIT) family protein
VGGSDCVFCRIVAGELPADVAHDGDRVLAFRDLDARAPLHVLVVPRAHHETLADLADADPQALAELVQVAREVARDAPAGAFRLVVNSGEAVGQSVLHAHAHVLAGRAFGWPPG